MKDTRCCSTFQYACALAEFGIATIPIEPTAKRAAVRWRRRAPDLQEIEPLLREGSNLGVILGRRSANLCSLDFDRRSIFEEWRSRHPALVAERLPVFSTGRGVQVLCRAPHLPSIRFDGGEILAEGHYTVVPPSIHPSGRQYQWIHEPTAERLLPIENAELGLEDLPKRVPTEDQVDPASILTLTDAVKSALPGQPHENHSGLWTLARALLSLQRNLGRDLTDGERLEAFSRYHKAAERRGILRQNFGRDDYLSEFLDAVDAAEIPLGSGAVQIAWEASLASPPPAAAIKAGVEEDTRKLAGLCRELQDRAGDEPFYLAVRTVQELLGLDHPMKAQRRLKLLQRLGLIHRVNPGDRDSRKAASYRYIGGR